MADMGTSDLPVNEPHSLRADNNVILAGQMETLFTPSRRKFQAYVTGSPNAARGLLLVHEWWGLTEHIKAEADHWGTRGYRVIAPDLYDGRIAQTSRDGARFMRSIEQRVANSKLGAVLATLSEADIPVFALGWCFGGGQVLQAGIAFPEQMAAVAMYYGRPELKTSRLARLRSPLLGIWAKHDKWITPKRVNTFATALTDIDRQFTFHEFDAGHAFANPSGDNYDSALAQEARRVTEEFFDKAID